MFQIEVFFSTTLTCCKWLSIPANPHTVATWRRCVWDSQSLQAHWKHHHTDLILLYRNPLDILRCHLGHFCCVSSPPAHGLLLILQQKTQQQVKKCNPMDIYLFIFIYIFILTTLKDQMYKIIMHNYLKSFISIFNHHGDFIISVCKWTVWNHIFSKVW